MVKEAASRYDIDKSVRRQSQQQNQDFVIASYETNGPEESFKVLSASNKPWAVKFRQHLKNAHGLDIAQSPIQINELIINWKK